jgi:opacity protein-like surface antigen
VSRLLRSRVAAAIGLTLVGLAGSVHAQPAPDPSAQPAPDVSAPPAPVTATPTTAESGEARDDEVGDQAIAAEVGLAGGGRVTPGGLRIAGHYIYQLSDRDWFDGAATFTFGSSQAACFRDRTDQRICSHGIGDGAGVEVAANIRRLFAPQGAFRPFARAGLGVGLIQFADDSVSGVALTLHAGGGVRVKVAPSIALVAEGDLALGVGSFGNGVGSEPQFGIAVTAGAEFRLR